MRLELGVVDFKSRLQGSELPPSSCQCESSMSSVPRSSRSSHGCGEAAVKLKSYKAAEWDYWESVLRLVRADLVGVDRPG